MTAPERLVLFIDRSLGRRKVADALRAAGTEVKVHDDLFPQDARDEVWIAEAGRRGWVVLSRDERIRYRAVERRAVERHGVGLFVLTSVGLNGEEMAASFVKAVPRIRRFIKKHPAPFIAKVRRDGSVEEWEAFGRLRTG
jgi:predicted nuclease of predicted toxin-antitoxin system